MVRVLKGIGRAEAARMKMKMRIRIGPLRPTPAHSG